MIKAQKHAIAIAELARDYAMHISSRDVHNINE